MKEKWLPVGGLAALLFAINVLGRIAAEIWADGDDTRQSTIGLVALIVIGLVMVAAAMRWVRRYPMPRVWGELSLAVAVACLLSVLLAPLLVGTSPFADGAGLFFRQIWWYAGITLAGALFGTLIVMTLGQDWKSRAWKRYADQSRARPRRVVRR